MKILGIIAEYNPFHTGHLYHLEEAKKRTSPDLTIIVMSGYYVQRGEPAIIDPYIRARIAVDYGADLVISLPLVYTLESADYFAHGAITLLHEMGVTDLCFGSEDGTLETFTNIAYAIKEHEADYHQAIRQAMNAGNRYSEACNSALKQICGQEIRLPNDLLGLAYVKEVILNHLPITLHTIKRTSSYHAL
ncbi:MAG: nucleotidyltransferase family protein, partial [bacterium]